MNVLENWLKNYTIEINGSGFKKLLSCKGSLPLKTRVYLTHIRDKDLQTEIFSPAIELQKCGLKVVPHLAARNIKDKEELELFLEKCQQTSINEILVLGGGINPPRGCYESTSQLLETGLFHKYNINKIGIAGHPEKHPQVASSILMEALQEKQKHAEINSCDMYIITQFGFSVAIFESWLKQLSQHNITLPVRLGLAGCVSIPALIKYAAFCGVGNSLQVLKSKFKDLKKLTLGYQPAELFEELSRLENTQIEGLHWYVFGAAEKTIAYVTEYLNNL